MRLTKKRKKLLLELIDVTFFLQALDSAYDSGNENEFKEYHDGSTFTDAVNAQHALVDFLSK